MFVKINFLQARTYKECSRNLNYFIQFFCRTYSKLLEGMCVMTLVSKKILNLWFIVLVFSKRNQIHCCYLWSYWWEIVFLIVSIHQSIVYTMYIMYIIYMYIREKGQKNYQQNLHLWCFTYIDNRCRRLTTSSRLNFTFK